MLTYAHKKPKSRISSIAASLQKKAQKINSVSGKPSIPKSKPAAQQSAEQERQPYIRVSQYTQNLVQTKKQKKKKKKKRLSPRERAWVRFYNKEEKDNTIGPSILFTPKKLSPTGHFAQQLIVFFMDTFQKGDKASEKLAHLILHYLQSSRRFLKMVRYLDGHYARTKHKDFYKRGIFIQSNSGSGSKFVTRGAVINDKSGLVMPDIDMMHIDAGVVYEGKAKGSIGEKAMEIAATIIHETIHAYRHAKRWSKYRGVARSLYEELRTRQMEVGVLKQILRRNKKALTKDPKTLKRLQHLIKHATVKGNNEVEKLINVGQSIVSGTQLTYLERHIWTITFNQQKLELKNTEKALSAIFKKYSLPKLPDMPVNVEGTAEWYKKALISLIAKIKKVPQVKMYSDVVLLIDNHVMTNLKIIRMLLKKPELSPMDKYLLQYQRLIALVVNKTLIQKERKKTKAGPDKANSFLKRFFDIDKTYRQIIERDMKKKKK